MEFQTLMKTPTFILLCSVLGLAVAGCAGDETKLSPAEQRNFQEGMSAEKVKEIGPAPTPPPGPLKGYDKGSAADKAQGR